MDNKLSRKANDRERREREREGKCKQQMADDRPFWGQRRRRRRSERDEEREGPRPR